MSTDSTDPVLPVDPVDPVDAVDAVDPSAPAEPPVEETDRRSAARRRSRRAALLEFYEDVGRRLGLPGKKSRVVVPSVGRSPSATARTPGEPVSDPKPVAPAWRGYTRKWLPVSAVLLLLISSASLVEWPTRSRMIPLSFRGTWVSAHVGYEGRKMILTESTMQVFVNGEATAPPATVRSANVRSTYLGPALRLVIRTADGADTLEMTLLTPSKLTLRRPADVVWERLADQRASPPAPPLPRPKAGR